MPGQVSSTALVRYRLVDYSAPAVHAHKKVTVKGYVDRVEVALGAEIVAHHRRSYIRGDVVYDPLHYLSLLEKKPGALDQAAPLRGWKLDPAFDALRRLLEARFGPRGKREYIQVLRLLEDFPEHQVTAAVQDALKRRLIGIDAVKHLLLARIETRPGRLDLSRYPHLPPALHRRHAGRRLRRSARRGRRPWLSHPASCSSTTRRSSNCPPSCANTRSWRASAPTRGWVTCSSSPGWWR